MLVETGRIVTLEYTVRLENGRHVDSTGDCGPLAIMYGNEQLFPPLESRIRGMRPGETREVRIPATEAYGESRPELIRSLPRDRLPPGLELRVGGDYRLKTPDGKSLRFRVLAVGATEVRADFNPPGAGQALIATVTVVSVRAATPEEERRGRA
jgi:FKBP-type peptidyl-prolyl cis-trans isomerase 2